MKQNGGWLKCVSFLCVSVSLWFSVLHAEDKVNETKKDGITERVHAAALDWLDDYLKKNRNDELVPIAEAIADRLIAGGTIWVAGDPAFADELNFRAGGLAGIKVFAQGQKFEKSDVLIVGQLACNDRATRVFHPAFI